jgi:hypothetical protein
MEDLRGGATIFYERILLQGARSNCHWEIVIRLKLQEDNEEMIEGNAT